MSKEINAEHSIRQLFRYWHIEVIGINKEFGFFRLFSKLRNKPGLKYVFWWRMANFFYMNGYKKVAYFLHGRIKKKFSCDIMLGAQIGEGLTIAHHVGVVVTKRVKAGRNMKLTQNCVIGSVGKTNGVIVIGDDFFLGSNSCVISDSLVIGDNVTIGAMSFVNKDLSSNTTVYTEKVLRTIEKTASPSVA